MNFHRFAPLGGASHGCCLSFKGLEYGHLSQEEYIFLNTVFASEVSIWCDSWVSSDNHLDFCLLACEHFCLERCASISHKKSTFVATPKGHSHLLSPPLPSGPTSCKRKKKFVFPSGWTSLPIGQCDSENYFFLFFFTWMWF